MKRSASRALQQQEAAASSTLSTLKQESISKQITRVQAESTKLEWRIDKFEKLMKLYKNGQNLISKQFKSKTHPNDNVIWELHVYPNGKREEDNSHVSFFLRQVGLTRSEEPIMTEFQIYCVDSHGARVSVCRDTKDFTHQQGRGKFQVAKDRMESAFRPDGSVQLICEVEYFPPGCKVSVEAEESPKPLENEKTEIDLKELLDAELLTDCCIKVGNKLLKCHRCILALHSEVFKSMFLQDTMVEAQNGLIDITDSYYEPVRAMLEYMYIGHTDLVEQCPEDVLTVADKYAVIGLKEKCEKQLAGILNVKNLCDTIMFADTYTAQLLKGACVAFISKRHHDILKTADWKRLKKERPDLANDLLEMIVTGSSPERESRSPSSASFTSSPVKMEQTPSSSEGRPVRKRPRRGGKI